MKEGEKMNYAICWKDFKEKQVQEATCLLKKRFKANNLSLDLAKGKTVLDVGCGSGRYSLALLKFGAKKVYGIDINEPIYKHKKFIFKKMPLTNLTFPENSFDFIFANGSAHYVENTEQVFQELQRVLKPNGTIWILVANKHKYWKLADKIREKLDDSDAKAFRDFLIIRGWEKGKIFFLLDNFFGKVKKYYSFEELKILLQKTGFKKIRHLTKDIEPNGTLFNLRALAVKK
ncbi:MAG TPA: class I SAM-dependent methyltransferase [archaeon]|nr:class I SAM-dependent methyltransferase [archaeon]